MTEQRIVFEIVGSAVPKERARTFYDQRSGRSQTRTPRRTREWEAHVQSVAIVELAKWRQSHKFARWIARGAFGLSCEFHLRDSYARDLSNLIKGVEDGMQRVLYDDDEQIAEYGRMRRFYDADRPRVLVDLWRLEPDDGEGSLE